MEKNCNYCKRKAVTFVDAGNTPLCAFHFVKLEDEECLKARLLNDISEYNKIKEHLSIQKEIKKQRPNLFSELKDFFD